jgi:hypothetical protein
VDNEINTLDGLVVRMLFRYIRDLYELDVIEVRLNGLRAFNFVRLFESA